MSTFAHLVFSDMELDRKFEIATSCRSVTLGSSEHDQHYPIVRVKRIKHALRPELPVSHLRFAHHLRERFSA